MLELTFSTAEPSDAVPLASLINSAYRGESSRQGWTTEADLLEGRRTEAADIAHLIAQADSLIVLCRQQQELLGSVHLQHIAQQTHIGMLAVTPALQNQGIGKHLLAAAENQARQTWQSQCFVMAVIPCRTELIAFYERRGYRRTGVFKEFPVNPAMWTPKVPGLALEMLEKPV